VGAHDVDPDSLGVHGKRPYNNQEGRSSSPLGVSHVVKHEEDEASVASPVAARREIPKARERENRGGVKEQLQKLADMRKKESDANALSSMLGL
jgi:hypothetical protein